MLYTIASLITFHPYTVEDGAFVQCSACCALVPVKDQRQHARFHDDLRTIARRTGSSY
jgi:hypothetical protein